MWIVKDSKGAVVLIASRKQDAEAIVASGPADKKQYFLEKV